MKFLAATLSLLSLASAGPLQQRQSSNNGSNSDSPFVLNGRWSNSPLNGSINANGGSFWNGKPTASYCPDNVPGCKEVNTTTFVGRDGNLFLNTGVPGGQQGTYLDIYPSQDKRSETKTNRHPVYISPAGLLTYTVPHSANIPEGSLTDLKIFSTNNFVNPFLTFRLCSVDDADTQWHIITQYTNATTGAIMNSGYTKNNACTQISLEAVPYEGDVAWEYT